MLAVKLLKQLIEASFFLFDSWLLFRAIFRPFLKLLNCHPALQSPHGQQPRFRADKREERRRGGVAEGVGRGEV